MPTSNNTSSPVKRPGLARRSVSSHAIITPRPSSSNTTDLAHSQTQKAPVHKPYRPHVVGGAHRTHARNPSFGKNLNKLQRLTSGQNLVEGHAYAIGPGTRQHQRKKSAPVTPAASPGRGHHHVRWDAPATSLGDHKTHASIKKNFSTGALRRNSSSILGKKALVTDRPQSAKGQPKKSVGFELGDPDDDEDEGEWEDSTQSPESTRRNSVAPSKESAENSTVLVDPLTFVKRPYPRAPQATSLPESTIKSLSLGVYHSDEEDHEPGEEKEDKERQEQQEEQEEPEQPMKASEHEDIAVRLLSQSRPSKAPPAMSSISAMAKPATISAASRNASLTNLASAHDASRRSHLSTSNPAAADTPGTQAHATSSSIEGGVSRFIINKDGRHAASRTDSDPNTPSSFLPNYHPQTPPSPGRGTTYKKTKASPPSRLPGAEPPSRTQQKLWLQRTAALTTSPPDSHDPSSAISPSTMDPAFLAATHSRANSRAYDGARVVNGGGRIGGAAYESEAKHIRKVYEKTASELTVVRRFQSPSNDSFKRVRRVMLEMDQPSSNPGSLTKSVKSAPALANIGLVQTSPSRTQHRRVLSRSNNESDTGSSQLNKNKNPGARHSRVYFQDQDDIVNISPSEPVDRLDVDHHPTIQHLSTSDDAAHGSSTTEQLNGGFFPDDAELMLRRLWESREVPTVG